MNADSFFQNFQDGTVPENGWQIQSNQYEANLLNTAMASMDVYDFDKNQSMLSVNQYQQESQKIMVAPNNSFVCTTINLCNNNPQMAINNLLRCGPDDICAIARDSNGSKFIQNSIVENDGLRKKVLDVLKNDAFLVSLAKDSFANFVVQKMITIVDKSSTDAKNLFYRIADYSLELSFNRYACRVVQQLVTTDPDRAPLVLNKFIGCESEVTKDQNANHIVQRILEKCSPVVYAPFVNAFVNKNGLKSIIENKYGCHVVQMCLERIVKFCEDRPGFSAETKPAYDLLHVLIVPILRGAKDFSENEYANYIIQFVIRTEFLDAQRKYIIKNCILHNILWLSQGKYASHVVEQALVFADSDLLRAMVWEILDGYEPDARRRDALDIMLFDQYANYVIQRLLKISIDVCLNQREGSSLWIKKISKKVKENAENLQRFSSGKKILKELYVMSKKPNGHILY